MPPAGFAIMPGSYYARVAVELMMVRSLVESDATWDAAVAAFHEHRAHALGRPTASTRHSAPPAPVC